MKRIVCLCVLLLCSISFVYAQGRRGRTTRTRKPVVRNVNLQFAEAERAWVPFWNKFREVVKNRDLGGLEELLSEDFEYPSGMYYMKIGRQIFIDTIKNDEDDGDGFWEEISGLANRGVTKLLKPKAKIRTASPSEKYSTKGISKISKIAPANWDRFPCKDTSSFAVFEFDGKQWFFSALLFSCETE